MTGPAAYVRIGLESGHAASPAERHAGALNDEENWSWAVKEIWDRLDGKAHHTVEASFDDKRSALDWTTDELVAFLNEEREDRDGAHKKKASDREPDSVQARSSAGADPDADIKVPLWL